MDELEIAERMKLPNSCCLISALYIGGKPALIYYEKWAPQFGKWGFCLVAEVANRAALLTGGIVDDG